MTRSSKIMLAAVGNPYRHDDGIGLEIIKTFRAWASGDQQTGFVLNHVLNNVYCNWKSYVEGSTSQFTIFQAGSNREEDSTQLIFFDGGTDGLSLIDQLGLYDKAIIIDAVFMGEPPGTVKLFTPQEARFQIKSDASSTHGFGLAEVFKLVTELEISAEIKIIGIEPLDVNFGEGLSEVVTNQIPQILDLVKSEIFGKKNGEECLSFFPVDNIRG